MTREELIHHIRYALDIGADIILTNDEGKEVVKALEQEPSNDMVSRKVFEQVMWERNVAINQLKELGYGLGEKPKTGYWIPVSERLPKEFESVLVCFKSQGGMAQAVSERLVNMDGSSRWSALCGIVPIAWMPLPKPYKAESEDKE